jgi:hypothetical protein
MKKKFILLTLPGVITVLFLIGCKNLINEAIKGEIPVVGITREH